MRDPAFEGSNQKNMEVDARDYAELMDEYSLH
jgi:hypothetical protein